MKKRKSKKHTQKHIAANMSAAAALTGKSYSLIQFSKNSGCDAFNANNTVNILKLEKWFKRHKEIVDGFLQIPDMSTEEAYGKRADRQRKEFSVLKLAGLLVPA